jgi:trimethylamine--corrinoid protein Co-methyltransferase
LAAIWQVSEKHVQTESIVNDREMLAAIEMAAILAGGRNKLKERPLLSIMECTISPLAHDGGSLEAGMAAAEAGLPVGFMTMASCGSTGPVTLAGNLVVGNAEVLSAMVLLQMASPGCPVYYAAAQTATDLRTGAYTGGWPEDYLFGAATNILADFYKLPLSMGAFATGAKEPDWQAAVDNSLSSFMAVSTLSDMLLGVGYCMAPDIILNAAHGLEIWSIIPCSKDWSNGSLALDVIRDIGQAVVFSHHPRNRAKSGDQT